MLKKVNPTIITLGGGGIITQTVGFYVNNVTWGPVGEQKPQAASDQTASTGTVDNPANQDHPTWAASATGRVEPKSGEVRISADVPGRIDKVAVGINDRVKAGDLLVRLDDGIARAKIKSATAQAAS